MARGPTNDRERAARRADAGPARARKKPPAPKPTRSRKPLVPSPSVDLPPPVLPPADGAGEAGPAPNVKRTRQAPASKPTKQAPASPKPARAKKTPSARERSAAHPAVAEANSAPLVPARTGREHCPPGGRRALAIAKRKAAKFQVQVAAASSLDDPPPATVGPPLPAAQPGKTYGPLAGRHALARAVYKAAKFQAQTAAEPAAAAVLDEPPPIAAGTVLAPPAAAWTLPPSASPLPRIVLHSTRAKRALSSPRGQRALELAMRKAAAARAASAPPPTAVPPAVEIVVPATPARRTLRRFVPLHAGHGRRTVLPWALAAVVLAVVSFAFLRPRERPPAVILAKPRPSLEWLYQAQDRAEEGSFRLALNTVERALTDSPQNAALLKFKGDMHQSLFEFGDAQSAYQQALNVDPRSKGARENLLLSRRLGRAATRSTGRLSMLYGLHRAMLAQGRIDEAVAISNRLSTDHELAQETWQAALDRTGLRGRVTVDEQGVMSLDLSESVGPDLTLLQKFPVRSLCLAGTGVEDLRPLAGMGLETLDLSRTPVHDLAPLANLPLKVLRVARTGVVDLLPLKNCPLTELDLSGTRVAGVEALARTPLTSLRADDTPLADLRPLAALPLASLSLARTRVADLRPLGHLGLQELILDGTNVSDLSALKDSPVRTLSLADTPVADLAPLAGMPLAALNLRGCRNVRDLCPLLRCAELEHLSLPPGAVPPEALRRLPHLRFLEGVGEASVTSPPWGQGPGR